MFFFNLWGIFVMVLQSKAPVVVVVVVVVVLLCLFKQIIWCREEKQAKKTHTKNTPKTTA